MFSQKVEVFKWFDGLFRGGIKKCHCRGVVRDTGRREVGTRANEAPGPLLINQHPINFRGDKMIRVLFVSPSEMTP